MKPSPYRNWPHVPVMFDKCETREDQVLHRIRRAFEKIEDSGYGVPLWGPGLVLEKLLVVPGFLEFLGGEKEKGPEGGAGPITQVGGS